MKLTTFLAVMVALSAPAPLLAAPDVLTAMYGAPNSDAENVTLRTSVASLFEDGVLIGCSVNFTVLHRDYAYHDGELSLLDGSLSMMYFKGKAISGGLKLGVAPLGAAGPLARTAPVEVAVIGDRTNNSAKQIVSSFETQPGFRMFALDLTKDDQPAFLEAVAKAEVFKRINGYYTLRPGGLGSNFYVDMRVRSFEYGNPASLDLTGDAGGQLSTCTADLMDLAKADETRN